MSEKTEKEKGIAHSSVFRVGLLLLVVLVVFVIVRQMAIPKSFGQYGFYRGDSVSDYAAMKLSYASSNVCQHCHQDKTKTLSDGKHEQLNCQVCHGPVQDHTVAPLQLKPALPVANEALCASCHADIGGRPNTVIYTVDVDSHSAGIACGQCHDPHQPLTIRGNEKKFDKL